MLDPDPHLSMRIRNPGFEATFVTYRSYHFKWLVMRLWIWTYFRNITCFRTSTFKYFVQIQYIYFPWRHSGKALVLSGTTSSASYLANIIRFIAFCVGWYVSTLFGSWFQMQTLFRNELKFSNISRQICRGEPSAWSDPGGGVYFWPGGCQRGRQRILLRSSQQCCGTGMFTPDPDFCPSRIPDPKTVTKEQGEKKLVVLPFL
jgi:hypothetical protein